MLVFETLNRRHRRPTQDVTAELHRQKFVVNGNDIKWQLSRSVWCFVTLIL